MTSARLSNTTAGGEDDLAELKCIVLESMRETLVKNVDPTKFLPFLRSRFVLDARESDIIKSSCSRSVFEGADKLVDVLCTKGAKGYDVFCKAILHDETQLFLLKALNKRLELAKHKKMEQEAAHAEQLLEQRRLREQMNRQPYNAGYHQGLGAGIVGGGPAHTTSFLKHTHARQRLEDTFRMRSPKQGLGLDPPVRPDDSQQHQNYLMAGASPHFQEYQGPLGKPLMDSTWNGVDDQIHEADHPRGQPPN